MIVRRNTLLAALAATTADDTRYFLNGIRLEPATHSAVATDGHILIKVTDTAPIDDADFPIVPGAEFHGDPAPFVLPADIAKAMIATMPKKSTLPVLETVQVGRNGSDTTVQVSATDLQAPRTATVKLDECHTFPAYERVIPAADRPEVVVCLSVEVLENIIKAAKAISPKGSKAPRVVIYFGIPTDEKDRQKGAIATAIRVTVNSADGLRIDGAAMPCRA